MKLGPPDKSHGKSQWTSKHAETIELYIRTRRRAGDAACTNATGPQGDPLQKNSIEFYKKKTIEILYKFL